LACIGGTHNLEVAVTHNAGLSTSLTPLTWLYDMSLTKPINADGLKTINDDVTIGVPALKLLLDEPGK